MIEKKFFPKEEYNDVDTTTTDDLKCRLDTCPVCGSAWFRWFEDGSGYCEDCGEGTKGVKELCQQNSS